MNAVEPRRPETRECYNCGKRGHISAACPEKKKRFDFGKKEEKQNKREDAKDMFALNVCNVDENKDPMHDAWPQRIEWNLDSGYGRHLTGCPGLLGENADKAGTSLILPDGTRTKSLRKDSIEMDT